MTGGKTRGGILNWLGVDNSDIRLYQNCKLVGEIVQYFHDK